MSNKSFNEQLIDDSVKYQLLYKEEERKYNMLEQLYNEHILELKSIISEKEQEINVLKNKNMKHLMEIGACTSRNYTLTNDKHQLYEQLSNLTIKNSDLEDMIHDLNTKYQDLQKKYVEMEFKHLQDMDPLIKTICEINNNNQYLKQQLENEKQQFNDLQMYLQNSYQIIFKLMNQPQIQE